MTAQMQDLILKKIKIIEYNIRRLSTLVEVDMAETPDTKVPVYCCVKATAELNDIVEILKFKPKNMELYNAIIKPLLL